MANHVNSQLHFLRMNNKAKERLAMILKWNEMQQPKQMLENFHDIMEHAPEQPDYNWYHDHIGPKWCYFEEYDLDHLHCTSAWGWPDKGYDWIVNELRKEDPYLLAQCTYEDEAPCFYGVAGWGPGGHEDYYMDMDEGRDLWKRLGKPFEFIQPHLEENEEGEMPEEYHEMMYEAIGTHQDMMWDLDCRGDVEIYDDEGEEVEYEEDGTPKKDVQPTYQQ